MPSASRHGSVERYQKGHARPMVGARRTSRPLSQASEMDDTEFEEDFSDVEEYSGRRSEESVGVIRLFFKLD